MALDQTANFVRGSTSESVDNSQTTIGVNDANTYPDPNNGHYNLVLWDDANHPRPDQDPDVEIIRVTGRDTTNSTITVSRGQESTTAVSHPSGSALHLSPTSAFFADVAAESQLYSDSDAISAINNDADHGSTAPHNYFSGSHNDLTNISSGDHHAKYTDSEARNAVTGSVDAADLVGGSGSAGQFLQTDGSALSWASVASGGVTHVQTSEPAYSEGATWLDPNTGIYRAAYDAGGGGDYHPVPPIQVTDEASDFTESDVTLTHNKTTVVNGRLRLSTTVGGSVNRTSDNSSDSGVSTASGFKVKTQTDIGGFEADISSNTSNAEWFRIYDSSGNILAETDISNKTTGDTIRVKRNIAASTTVYIGLDGSSWTRGDYYMPEFPYTTNEIEITAANSDIEGGSSNDSTSIEYALNNIKGLVPETSGDCLIEWPSPSPDVETWDLASFRRTLDNATVTIDVEDGAGNVLFSDIGRNFDISTVSSDKNVVLHTYLSRTSTSNVPTLDYAARRYVV